MKLSNMTKRFWSQVEKTDGCWLWTGTKGPTGYGKFASGYAHRFSWQIATGESPLGKVVCHSCDNPTCVNPEHLFMGTHKDNVRDCMNKGRFSPPPVGRGEKNGNAKITEDIAIKIREEFSAGGVTKAFLGRKYGISSAMASLIVRGKNWK